MASSQLIARHARETGGRLAPGAHFAKFESRHNGNVLRTLRDGRYAVTDGAGDQKSALDLGARSEASEAKELRSGSNS
jgi:hypothetical protein